MIIVAGVAIAWVVSFMAWLAHAARNAPIVDETACVRYVSQEDVLITPQGVEIPLCWLASADDIDEVIATLYEIDGMGIVA